MDVEAVLDDGCQLDLEGVVIDGLAAGDVNLQRGWFRPGEIANGNGAQPQGANDLLQVRGHAGVVGHRMGDREDVLLCLGAQRAVMFVGDGVEQGADARAVVVQSEIRGREQRRHLSSTLIEVGQDPDEVACFLGIGGDQHLLFEQAKQMGGKWP